MKKDEKKITGKIEDIDLVTVLQFFSYDKKERMVKVTLKDGKEGIIYVKNGNIVSCYFDKKEGMDAFVEIMGLKDYKFSIEKGVKKKPEENMNLPIGYALLKATAIIEENSNVVKATPNKEERGMEDYSQVLNKILEVKGVEGGVIVDPDGNLLDSRNVDNPEKLSSIVAFTVGAGVQIGLSLNLGGLSYSLLDLSDKKMLIIPGQEACFGVMIKSGASIINIVKKIKSILEEVEEA